MSSFNPQIPSDSKPVQKRSTLKGPAQGTITKTLGEGDNAKNSIIYITLAWSFRSAVALTIIVVANAWLFSLIDQPAKISEDLKLVWAIFMPIITLALGYAFGKAHK